MYDAAFEFGLNGQDLDNIYALEQLKYSARQQQRLKVDKKKKKLALMLHAKEGRNGEQFLSKNGIDRNLSDNPGRFEQLAAEQAKEIEILQGALADARRRQVFGGNTSDRKLNGEHLFIGNGLGPQAQLLGDLLRKLNSYFCI